MEVDIPIEILNAKALIREWDALNIEKKNELKKNELKKKYDSKAYNKKFYAKNKEKVSEKHICLICKGSYTYFNSSAHKKTQKHIKWMNVISEINVASNI